MIFTLQETEKTDKFGIRLFNVLIEDYVKVLHVTYDEGRRNIYENVRSTDVVQEKFLTFSSEVVPGLIYKSEYDRDQAPIDVTGYFTTDVF